jgi:hypothetical protein
MVVFTQSNTDLPEGVHEVPLVAGQGVAEARPRHPPAHRQDAACTSSRGCIKQCEHVSIAQATPHRVARQIAMPWSLGFNKVMMILREGPTHSLDEGALPVCPLVRLLHHLGAKVLPSSSAEEVSTISPRHWTRALRSEPYALHVTYPSMRHGVEVVAHTGGQATHLHGEVLRRLRVSRGEGHLSPQHILAVVIPGSAGRGPQPGRTGRAKGLSESSQTY